MKTKYLNHGIVLLALFLSPIFSSAQSIAEIKNFAKTHGEENYLNLGISRTLEIGFQKGELVIKETNIEEKFYLNNTSNTMLDDYVYQNHFNRVNEIKASSYSFEKGKYKEHKVENFTTNDVINQSFYDDTQTIDFTYPKLGKNAKSKLEYETLILDPKFLSPFFFGSGIPCLKYEITYIVDQEIDLDFTFYNLDERDLSYKYTIKNGKAYHNWVKLETPSYKGEPNAPSFKYVVPHIIPRIKSYTTKAGKTNVLNDLSALHGWYTSLIQNLNSEACNEELSQLSKKLVANQENELEQVKSIYYWTQKNIKYIDFENGLGGFIPRNANEIYERKFGDCKDNSSIMQEMLSETNISSHLTWIGTRKLPYTYEEVPSPVADNHMILTYKKNGQYYFLDATGRYSTMDYPTSFIQGKEALIDLGDGQFEVITVPVLPASKNTQIDSTQIMLVGNNIHGIGQIELTGYQKQDWFYRLENVKQEKDLKTFYRNRLMRGNNKFTIDNITETNKYSYDLPFKVDYIFTIEDIVNRYDNEIYLNLNLNQDCSALAQTELREHPIEREYNYSNQHTYILEIPSGYELTYIPENFEVKTDYLELSISYHQEDNKLFYTHREVSNAIFLEAEKQEEINALIKSIRKAFKETIVLKQSN